MRICNSYKYIYVLFIVIIFNINSLAQINYQGSIGNKIEVGKVTTCDYANGKRECDIFVASISYKKVDNTRLYTFTYARKVNTGFLTETKEVWESVKFYATEKEFESFSNEIIDFCSPRKYSIFEEQDHEPEQESRFYRLGEENLQIQRTERKEFVGFKVEILFLFDKIEGEASNTFINGVYFHPRQLVQLFDKWE